MKYIFLFTLLFPSFAFVNTSEETYTLTIEVSGIRNKTGKVALALYNTEDSFLSEEETYLREEKEVTGKTVKIVFKDLPKGEYSFAGFHDENNNGEMDKSFGVPKEGFCFSNNATVSLGPPDYEDAVFTLDKDVFQKVELKFML